MGLPPYDPRYGVWSAKYLKPGTYNLRMVADAMGCSVDTVKRTRQEWNIGTLRTMALPRAMCVGHRRGWRRKFWTFTQRDFELLVKARFRRSQIFRYRQSLRARQQWATNSDRPVPRPSPYIARVAKELRRAQNSRPSPGRSSPSWPTP